MHLTDVIDPLNAADAYCATRIPPYVPRRPRGEETKNSCQPNSQTRVFRSSRLLDHRSQFHHPDPKGVRAHFHSQTELLKFLIPTIVSVAVTYFFVTQVMHFATWPRRLQVGLAAAFVLWLFAYWLLFCGPTASYGLQMIEIAASITTINSHAPF